ncbi:hypothetical protein BFN03_08690 [Rhodococcus sp. WMMA185]|nr:hypothetical protein BFN03_08690 [Rhodococcus sp. WMMA185]
MKRNLDAYIAHTIAVIAFALFYSKLFELTSRVGYGAGAYLWPFVVDDRPSSPRAQCCDLRTPADTPGHS